MIRCLFSVFLLLLFGSRLLAQSYGLGFNSHAVVQENRTSLDLSPNDSICFGNSMQMDFDLNFLSGQEIYFGYIVRLVNSNQNIDLMCTQNTFKVVIGQQLTNIVFTLDTTALFKKWSHFSLSVDAGKQSVSLKVNGQHMGTQPVAIKNTCFHILWGANDHYRFNTRDLPPMQVKDILLLDEGKEKNYWPLSDTSGTTSTDNIGHRQAAIKNPVWVKPKHQHWQPWSSFVLNGNAVIAFDPVSDRLYVAGSDSLGVINPTQKNHIDWYPSGHPGFQLGNQAVFSPLTNKMYGFSIDQHRVLSLDPATHNWTGSMHDSILTEYWHANKLVSPVDTSLYMIGGYGQLKYKNTIFRYSLIKGGWEKITPGGDNFTPRYLAALGLNQAADTAFIIGGYGSPTGDQMLNPGYYYDMFAFDIRHQRFSRMFTIDSANPHYVFANSLVINPDDGHYYGLTFENGSFDTQLKLVRGGLNGSPLEYLGDAIPFAFYDIQSFVDLYYSPRNQKLIAVTLFCSPETEKHKTTRVKIFTLDFPPERIAATVPANVNTPGWNKYRWLIAAALVSIFGAFVWQRKKTERINKKTTGQGIPAYTSDGIPQPVTTSPPQPLAEMATTGTLHTPVYASQVPDAVEEDLASAANQVLLFGQFQVNDSEEADITKSFTPLLKELFLLILVYTYRNGKGIPADLLSELLWHDKSQKDAKNNRAVNLAKLKTVLEKTDHSITTREGGYLQLQSGTSGKIDYRDFIDLQRKKQATDNAYIKQLLSIAGRGSFLQQTEYNWLDDIKAEVSNQVIDDCLSYIHSVNLADEAELVIEICNTIFNFDRLNEDALVYKCKGLIHLKRHALANTTYLKFTKEYREIYGEEFPKSFNEVIR